MILKKKLKVTRGDIKICGIGMMGIQQKKMAALVKFKAWNLNIEIRLQRYRDKIIWVWGMTVLFRNSMFCPCLEKNRLKRFCLKRNFEMQLWICQYQEVLEFNFFVFSFHSSTESQKYKNLYSTQFHKPRCVIKH